MIKHCELNCSDFMLEITEETLIENFKNTKAVISTLPYNAVQFTIDDFCVGYSQLSYIQNLSRDTIKIDKSFIQNVKKNLADIALIKTIFLMAR